MMFRRSLSLSSLNFCFSFCCWTWVFSIIPSYRYILLHPFIYSWFPLVWFLFQLLYSSILIGSFLYFLFFIANLSEFFYSLQPSEQFYDNYFKFFIWHIAYLHFIQFVFLLRFFLFLSWGAFSSVSTFCLTFCVCFYGLVRKLLLQNLKDWSCVWPSPVYTVCD